MKNSALISVIVPVYGVEKYIDECLESVVGQTYKNLEIILVDDASVDGSGKKCDEWAQRDDRIIVEHKAKNAGLNMARKTGFDLSHGEYVTFVDSDDFLHKEYVTRLHQIISQSDADIAICGYSHFSESAQGMANEVSGDQAEVSMYAREEMIKEYLTAAIRWPHTGNPANAHCKLFRRRIISDIDWKLSDYSVGEDDFMSLQFYNLSSKNVVTNDKIYFYRINPSSISSSKSYGYKYDQKTISPFQLCDNYYELATKTLGSAFASEVLYKTYTLYMYYIWNSVQKECLNADDVVLFNKTFPLNQILADKNSDYDSDVIDALKDGGLLKLISSRLNTLSSVINDRDAEIARLSSVINDRDAEIARLSSVINDRDAEIARTHEELKSIKRSMRLVLGNVKRKVAKTATKAKR